MTGLRYLLTTLAVAAAGCEQEQSRQPPAPNHDAAVSGEGESASGASAHPRPSPTALAVQIELQGAAASAVTVSCDEPCVDLSAVAAGGSAPYQFTWQDGATTSSRHECPTVTTTYTVTATDTPSPTAEFSLTAETAAASITLQVSTCMIAAPPAQPDPPAMPPSELTPSVCPSVPTALLHVSNAGDGTHSGCPERRCAGLMLSNDADQVAKIAAPLATYRGCTAVSGDLLINMQQTSDLTELACLELVTGRLVIWNSPGLQTLQGLESLREVGGDLNLGYYQYLGSANDALTGFDGLESLQVVGGDLFLSGGLELRSLGEFPLLAAVGGKLFIALHAADDLSGLNALRFIGGALSLWHANGLRTISGLRSLESIAGAFMVEGAADLTELPELSKLTCSGGVVIEGNSALVRFDTLGTLKSVAGDVTIRDNPLLPICALRQKLTELGPSQIAGTVTLTGELECSPGLHCRAGACVMP